MRLPLGDKDVSKTLIRWWYTRWFATMIFSATQHCNNIVATLPSFKWLQHYSNVGCVLHWKSLLRIVLCNITFNAGHTGIKIMLVPLDSPPHTIFTVNFNLITMIAIFAIIIIIIFILTTIFCKCLSLAFIMTEVSTWRVDKYLCCHHTNPSLWQPWRRYILSHKRFLSSQVYNHIMTT